MLELSEAWLAIRRLCAASSPLYTSSIYAHVRRLTTYVRQAQKVEINARGAPSFSRRGAPRRRASSAKHRIAVEAAIQVSLGRPTFILRYIELCSSL